MMMPYRLLLLVGSLLAAATGLCPSRSMSSSGTARTTASTTRLGIGNMGNMFGGASSSKTDGLPTLPRDVKDAVSQCRVATQAALENRISRIDVEFPVGAKFNVEPTPKKGRKSGGDGNGTPTKNDLDRSDRELARLFVDMFQPVGGDHLAVVFPEAAGADAAHKQWKGDPTAACRVLSLDRRRSSTSQQSKKKKSKSRGFAAKLAAEVDDNEGAAVGGPFQLPENTEVAIFVAPGPKELVIVERICEQVGMGTLVILLNARLSTIDNFGTTAGTTLFTEDFQTVFHLAAFQPQEAAPNCLVYRAYPGRWVLARKPSVGPPKSILVTEARPNADEGQEAYDNLEVSDMEKGVEDMVQNVAGWFNSK
jgi:hypothetical protein